MLIHQRLAHDIATNVALKLIADTYEETADERERMEALIYFKSKIQFAIELYALKLRELEIKLRREELP